jgi:hypothetical protein
LYARRNDSAGWGNSSILRPAVKRKPTLGWGGAGDETWRRGFMATREGCGDQDREQKSAQESPTHHASMLFAPRSTDKLQGRCEL